ncbi:MAG: SDR family oxidoreductase [Spongiibacteraceae bacterium]
MFSFEDKCALIFGGAKGIGRAIALEFSRRGAKIAIADIDGNSADETATTIIAAGGNAVGLSCDVCSDESVRATATAAEEAFGDIDIVVNNVGAILSGNPEDIPISEWQRIFNLNFFSAVRSNDYFLPKMLQRGSGYLVNTASFAGLYPYAANRMPYVAAKAAVIALSESLALYLLPQGIRVSCFCPGPVMTGVMQGMKTWSENVAMRGPGSQFKLMTAEEAAIALANGMIEERIVIPTHEEVWETVREHAASPDKFIHKKIAQMARGDLGLPRR